MDILRFEWDENKNEINKHKHGVSFETASTVFYDANAVVFDDPRHSIDEDRFIIIGLAENENLLLVSHCYKDNDNVIRIISARKANKKEEVLYNEY